MSERNDHLNDLSDGIVMFVADQAFDFETFDSYSTLTIVSGTKIPVYELEIQDCEHGCHTRALLHDTANDHYYTIGETQGPHGSEPPPKLVRQALRTLQGVLN
jgi:hypothetical protein